MRWADNLVPPAGKGVGTDGTDNIIYGSGTSLGFEHLNCGATDIAPSLSDLETETDRRSCSAGFFVMSSLLRRHQAAAWRTRCHYGF
jgi:hypothetical protein